MASAETANSLRPAAHTLDLAAVDLRADTLTAEDRAALKQLAAHVWLTRNAIAREWSQALIAIMPESFPAGELSAALLTQLNENFLSVVLTQVQHGDFDGLYRSYYEMTRRLIEADLQRAQAARVSLAGLYTSARVSLRVIQEHVGASNEGWLLAYTKLTAQLMMLVGRAYSDAREDYLQRVFEQINTLSHELRAPLSHLFGYLELLRAGEFGHVSSEQDRVLSDLIRETDDLLLLLTGTLDLSRLDSGRVDVHVEEFQVSALFSDVVNTTANPNAHVTWSTPPGIPVLRSDRVKLKQIVGNLLRNAIRYGGGSPVELGARLAGTDAVEITVRDHGPGIPPPDLSVIFDFFERGSAAGLGRDGYGIGLHVVRRLVELLHGRVEVESTVGHGACFRVTVPLHHDAPASARSV